MKARDYCDGARVKGASGFARRAKPTVITARSTATTPPCCLSANHRAEHGGRMPSRELPARPNLEQLKKQAKSLLDAA
ncbi:MAG TPA: hypothetical protein VH458_24095, partial [Vicinamibacterales bacterium]